MAKIVAEGVPYADHLNEAASLYGISPALLQGMLDIDGLSVFDLPDVAVEFALDFVRRMAGGATAQGVMADKDPRANIHAAAWYLSNVHGMYGSESAAIASFYGGGPVANLKATRIVSGPYERRRRQWA